MDFNQWFRKLSLLSLCKAGVSLESLGVHQGDFIDAYSSGITPNKVFYWLTKNWPKMKKLTTKGESRMSSMNNLFIYDGHVVLAVAKDLSQPESFIEYVILWQDIRTGGVFVSKTNKNGKDAKGNTIVDAIDLPRHAVIDLSNYAL